MNIPLQSAEALAAKLEEASALCSKSLRVVKLHENIGTLQVYARLAGLFLGNSYTNILAPLWHEHPELEPESMKQSYQEPIPSLSPESQAAISAFLSAAAVALGEAESTLALVSKQLPFGGVAEVSKTASAIAEFLQNPRFRDPPPQEPSE